MAAVAIPGLLALAWTGCSDDASNAAGPPYVDLGGTYGAEVTVTIRGRGRVRSIVPGLDCPGNCFAKYVFPSGAVDGAAGKVSLQASPTPGSSFKGWTFSTDPVGSRGRGPASCNPVLRPGSAPAVDENAAEIALPFGETTGTAPAGHEAACSSFTKVPLVYNITATFDTDEPAIIDAGHDTDDAGVPEVVYNRPTAGAVGKEIGITLNGYLYWHFTSGGQSGIAFGSTPDGAGPQTPLVIVSPSTPITLFEVDPDGVVYQTSAGTVSVIRQGLTTPTSMGGAPQTCTALAIDWSSNVYCRTSSTLVQWLYPSYAAPTILYSGLPSGNSNDLLVESAGGSAYFASSNAILSLPLSGADGSVAAPTIVVGNRTNPTNLEASGSRLFWLEPGVHVYGSSSKSVGATAFDTAVPPSPSFKHLAADPNSSSYFWVASSTAIHHVYYAGSISPGATRAFRTGLSGITGMTADSSYVYTSHTDGTIRRASALAF